MPRAIPWYAKLESMKRSHNTIFLFSNAGRTTSFKCCLRLAAYNNASVRSSISVLFTSSNILRMDSAILLPPGSRV